MNRRIGIVASGLVSSLGLVFGPAVAFAQTPAPTPTGGASSSATPSGSSGSSQGMPQELHGESLATGKFTLTSAKRVDLTYNYATLPLHRGVADGKTVWFVVTDASDQGVARQLGLNFAPRLANITVGCPGCAQDLAADNGAASLPQLMSANTPVKFLGAPDFSPNRMDVAGSPTPFPPSVFHEGARAGAKYSPFVMDANNVVYDAPIVAVGDGPFDVTNHTDTADRVLRIDPTTMDVDLLFVRGFANGKPILYLSFDSSDPLVATQERATFTPVLNLSPAANGGRVPSAARAAIFSATNGKFGTLASPPSQGQAHLLADGMIEKEANFSNVAVLQALAAGGDGHNVFDVFPTDTSPTERNLYSPLWDLQNFMYSAKAVAAGENTAKTDANVIRQLAAQGMVTSPGGTPLGSSGSIINCPALAFFDTAPTGPQAALPAGVNAGSGGAAAPWASGPLVGGLLGGGALLVIGSAILLAVRRRRT